METNRNGQTGGYPADCWPWTVLMRRDRGEPVSKYEMQEVAEYFARWKRDREAWQLERAEWQQREAEHLERLKLKPDCCEKILALAKAEAFGVDRLQNSIASVAATIFPPPSAVDHLMPAPEVELAAAERALRAMAELSEAIQQMHQGQLTNEYRAALYRTVRMIERRMPSMKNAVVVSRDAASLFAWNISSQLEHMTIALARQRDVAKSYCRPHGGQSALWKRKLLVSAIGALWDARRECGSNAAIPNGRDGSIRAFFELAKVILPRFSGRPC